MSWEIERRYLVRLASDARLPGNGMQLRQGYVVAGPNAVRIRTGEPRGPILTCKRGSGIKRREIEAVVSTEMADALFEAAGDRVLSKVRYRLGPWELDRFEGGLEGLLVLEIELESEDDSVPEAPDGVEILREVTMDTSFVSSALASLSPNEQRTLVARLYAEEPA